MFKKFTALSLAILVVNFVCMTSVAATQQPSTDARTIERVKARVAQISPGSDARVEVRLYDGRKVKGYIYKIETDSFTVIDEGTGVATNIAYSQVQKIKTLALSGDKKQVVKILVMVGVAAGLILGLGYLTGKN